MGVGVGVGALNKEDLGIWEVVKKKRKENGFGYMGNGKETYHIV